MKHNVSRAQLLSGNLNGEGGVFRPPWAMTEVEFIELCTGCGECVTACPDRLIKVGRGKLPEMAFARGGCDFCAACLDVCKPGALKRGEDQSPPWTIKASIEPNCLSLNAVVCRACGEVCDERSIRFKLEIGGVARPLLDTETCNGCGACFAVCPISAVTLSCHAGSQGQAA